MPPKTIHPRTNDDPRQFAGDPAVADIRKIQTELRARKPLVPRPYWDVEDERDDDLARYNEKPQVPEVPSRPPIQALIDAMAEFDKKPLASMDRRKDATKYERALHDPKNWVSCPMDGCNKQFTWPSALIDHLHEKHPEILGYDQWLQTKVATPFLHFRTQRKHAEEDFHGLESQIKRYEPLLKELQSRKQKIEDAHGVSEALYHYGHNSPESQIAQEKSADELAPVLRKIADVQRDIGTYTIRRNQAERQYIFADRKIAEMERDKDIAPLLETIALPGGKRSWRFTEERKQLEPIVIAISRAAASERAAWGDTGIPSKGSIIR
jgi:hypothetical protein